MEKIMSVKRFISHYRDEAMHVRNHGDWVKYTDYAKLESEHKSAMLTLDKIAELLGTSDKLSISEQVAALQLQVVNLAVENSTIKTMNDCLSEELRGYESDGAFDGPDMHKLWYSHAGALPATSVMLANIQAQGVEMAIKALVTSDDDDFTDAPNILAMVAYQLRAGTTHD